MNTLLQFITRTKKRIAYLSRKEQLFFSFFVLLFIIGALGGLIKLSYNQGTEVPLHSGTYREGIVGSPRFINPVLAYSDSDKDLTTLVYNGLVTIDEFGNPVPNLAESWDVSSDGKTYTFRLKPKLYFHDHKPLTSDDIVFTISKIQDSRLKSPLRVAWEGVTVSALDPQTIVFSLEKPYAGFIAQTTVGILPKHIWNDLTIDAWQTSIYNTEPIGSGSYVFKNVSRSNNGIPEEYHLTAFKKFSLGKPYIKDIIIKLYANKNDALDAFDSGSIDGLAVVAPTLIDESINKSTQIVTSPLPRVFGLFFNPINNKIFAESAVVSAIRIGVDKETLLETIFNGFAEPLTGPLPTSIDTSTLSQDEKNTLANKMLDNAGWKLNPQTGIREKTILSGGGKTRVTTPLSFSLSTANTKELEQSAQIIADSLKVLGIDVQIKVFELGILNEQIIRGRNFDVLLFGQVIKHDTDIFAFWHSTQKTDPGLNITGYSNATVDTLLEKTTKEIVYAKRAELYTTIAQQLAKDGPVVFLYAPELIYIIKPSVQNIIIPPITGQESRLGLISRWYLNTDNVWNIFVKK